MPLRRSKRLAALDAAPDAAAAAAPRPSLDMLPDDLVLKLEPHLRDVLLPRHLGRFASTSQATRRLLAERLKHTILVTLMWQRREDTLSRR